MRRIDTHQHLWDLKQFPCSWCAGLPVLNRTFDLNDYLAASRDTGIEKTVFVECDVDEPHSLAEAKHVQSLGESHPLIAGMVASTRPERADFPRQLDALLGLAKLRGLRRVLHVVPEGVSQSELFATNIRRLAEHKLTFDLCVQARQLPLAIRLARKCPEVQFILDHGGAPDVKAKAFEPWCSDIRELAQLPNVAVKISGLPAYAGESWQVKDLRPWVEHLLARFGWERVVWGGDWPVCTVTTTLRQWVATIDELLAGATEAERGKLFYANAEKFYRV